jgi:hypothetical protein
LQKLEKISQSGRHSSDRGGASDFQHVDSLAISRSEHGGTLNSLGLDIGVDNPLEAGDGFHGSIVSVGGRT